MSDRCAPPPPEPAPSRRTGRWALVMLLAIASCGHAPRALSPSTRFTAHPAGGLPVAARYAAAHVDHLQAGKLWPFVEARRRWIVALSRADTTDGRGLFVQTGDSGFLSLRPLASLGDLDREPATASRALAGVDAAERVRYEQASGALLAPPRRDEIWRFDPDLSFGTTDPIAALASAAWGKMTVDELDPTPAGDDYALAWKDIREALTTEGYPLVRVAYWSRYGTGDLITFWLAPSQTESLRAPALDVALRHALGEERAQTLLGRIQKAVLASDSVDVIPRVDLSSKSF